MSNAMYAFERNRQTAPSRPCLKRLDNGSWLQGSSRRYEAKENFSMVTISRYLFEVVLDRQTDRIRQRKFQWLARFALANVNLPFSPMKVGEGKTHDIAG